MLHDHVLKCTGALIFVVGVYCVFMTKTAKKIDERELYKKDSDKFLVEDYEEIWTKPDKKVS